MESIETLSVEKTAKLLKKDPQWVRLGLQQQQLSFGSAVQMPTGHWSYHIVATKVYEYADVKEKDENEN